MQASRTKNTTRNAAFGILNKILVLALSIISRKVFILYIGITYLGLQGLFMEIIGMLSLADLGFDIAVAYSYYMPLAENDTEKIAALTAYFKKIYRYIAIAVTVIGLAIIPFLPLIVRTEEDVPYVTFYYLLYLVKTVVSYLYVYKFSIISADQKNYIVVKYEMGLMLTKVLMQIAVIVFTHSFVLYILCDVVEVAVRNLIFSKKAEQMYPYIEHKTRELNEEEKKTIFEKMKAVFVYKAASVFFNSTDNTLMSIFVGTATVGIYQNYWTTLGGIESFVNIFFSAFSASLGNLAVDSTPKKKYDIFKTMQMMSFYIGAVLTVGLFFCLNDFVVMIFGADLQLDFLSVVMRILNSYMFAVLSPIWVYRAAVGLHEKAKMIMVYATLVNFVLSVILGYRWGTAGILTATLIARLSTYFWYETKILYKDYFDHSMTDYFVDHILNAVMIFGIIVVLHFAFLPLQEVNLINWVIKGSASVILTTIVLFLRYFKTQEFGIISEKLNHIMKR